MREHAKAARDAGHRVVVLHLAGSRPDLAGTLWTMEQELDPSLSEGIEVHHVFHRRSRVPGASYGLYVWSAISAYRRLLGNGFRPDVIHAQVYGAAVPAAVVARRSMIPLVVTEHYSGVAQRSLSRLEVRKARYAYERAARVLPVSRFLEESIRSLGIDAPYEVVPNVVDTSLFFPAVSRSQERQGERRQLLFVGSLESDEYKGFPTLLGALAHLGERRRDWRLDVIGDGPERARYEASAVERGLADRITFHGALPKPVVAEMMRQADLFVLPSRLETFGVAIAEALACGLPVVSTTAGGIPELVNESNGRLVPPDDPAALSDALRGVLENLESFNHLAISAAARDRYSPEVVGEQLTQIYESVQTGSRVQALPQSPAQPPRKSIRNEQGG